MFAARSMLQSEVIPETEWRTIHVFAFERMGHTVDLVQRLASRSFILASLLMHPPQINRHRKPLQRADSEPFTLSKQQKDSLRRCRFWNKAGQPASNHQAS
jgi:hypothetical protein